MTTATKNAEKTLVYDGDCPMCTSVVALLIRSGLVRADQTRSNHDLSGDDFELVRAAGIRNQLIVLDPEARTTEAGTSGLLWVIGENFGNPLWIRMWRLPVLNHLLEWGYRTVAYNRRVISPPRSRIVCDCEPEVTVARRLNLIVPLLIVAIAIWAALGAGALGSEGAGALVAALGLPWSAMALAGLALLRGESRLDYVAHLAVTAFAGSLVLLPGCIAGAFAAWIPPSALLAFDGVSLLAAALLTTKMQRRRVAALGLSPRWLWAYAVVTLAGLAGLWIWLNPSSL